MVLFPLSRHSVSHLDHVRYVLDKSRFDHIASVQRSTNPDTIAALARQHVLLVVQRSGVEAMRLPLMFSDSQPRLA
ncbi:hypothetical protein NL459_27845, partial [Klebsiella pneumoniae]|nr:hypothetical protein [Klebsiella pneumoniae]